MFSSTKARVFHLPAVVGDHGPSLARIERSLGMKSVSLAEMPSAFGFDADHLLWHQGESPIRLELRRWRWFVRILLEADVVHYNWGRTLFPDLRPRRSPAERGWSIAFSRVYRLYGRVMAEIELRLLRIRGVRIIVTFQGDDARQADCCRRRGALRTANAMPNDSLTPLEDEWRRRVIARFDRFASAVFALNPDLCHVLPRRTIFLPYLHWDSRQVAMPCRFAKGEIVIAHAPSVRARKGTDAIISAVDSLRAKGYAVQLRLIESMPHHECICAMGECDIFVDQLLYGWYGGAAVEAMSLGLPTIAYIDETNLPIVPSVMADQLPVISATPETVEDAIRQLVEIGSAGRARLGAVCRRFVETWHDPLTLARSVVGTYGIGYEFAVPPFMK